MTADILFRKARAQDLSQIWKILQQAIQRRKEEGSNQWQDGYPNLEVIQHDLNNEHGFVLADGDVVIGYTAVLITTNPNMRKLRESGLQVMILLFFTEWLFQKINLEKAMRNK